MAKARRIQIATTEEMLRFAYDAHPNMPSAEEVQRFLRQHIGKLSHALLHLGLRDPPDDSKAKYKAFATLVYDSRNIAASEPWANYNEGSKRLASMAKYYLENCKTGTLTAVTHPEGYTRLNNILRAMTTGQEVLGSKIEKAPHLEYVVETAETT